MNKEQAEFIMVMFEKIWNKIEKLEMRIDELEKGNKRKRSKKSN